MGLRVLFMMDLAPDANSGAAGTEIRAMQALRALGHEVDAVWAPDLPRLLRHGNLHYLLELPRAYQAVLRRRFRDGRYDVVHVNQPYGYRAAKALRRIDPRAVFVHRSHGFELRVSRDLKPWREQFDLDRRTRIRRVASQLVGMGLDRSSELIARYADGHIVSAGQCAELLMEIGVSADQIAVIPQAPPEVYHRRPLTPMSAERRRRVLYISQFAFFKAPMIVAAAMNQMAEAEQGLEFTWVCAGRHHIEVRRLLGSHLRDRVQLLDWMPQAQLLDIYDRHGIFLFPSFFEGFGKVFLEAMARGLCVVAADNSGARDVIRDGVDGVRVATGDAGAVAGAALSLVRQGARAEAISRAAAERAREYTWARVGRETEAFYQRLLWSRRSMHSGLLPRPA